MTASLPLDMAGAHDGLIDVLFGRRVRTVDAKCRALGDECCEFVLSEAP